jgi:hypothetical protein
MSCAEVADLSARLVQLNEGQAGEARSRKALRRPARPQLRLRRSRWLDSDWELNGCNYTAAYRHGYSAMESELFHLGIDYKHSRPYHPQTCGKVERFH